jgi:tetratricopeptide (TPR) repeat protein
MLRWPAVAPPHGAPWAPWDFSSRPPFLELNFIFRMVLVCQVPTRRYLSLIVAAACIAGCHQRPQQAAGESREICLADPDGSSPIDDAIRRAQAGARRLDNEPHSWTLVGQGWVRKARVSGDPGFYINVRACGEAAMAVAPGNRAALQLLGLSLMNDHRFAEARDVAREILRREPDDTVALGFLSDALLELGDLAAAAAAAQRMVDLQPDMASYSRAAYFRWLTGDAKTARLFMQYALNGRDLQEREPAAWTFVQAATMYWHEGDYDGADAVFAEALKWVPDYPPALTGRARVQMSLGRPARAVEYLEKAYRIARLPETAWLLGDACEMLGDARKAKAAFDLVIREGRKMDRLTLALFLATKNRDVDEALRLIEEERRTRGGVYVDDAYAWALYRAGRLAEARDRSDRALAWGTPDARLLYHAGVIRVAGGDERGRDLIRRAMRLNPGFDVTAAAEVSRMLTDGSKDSVF